LRTDDRQAEVERLVQLGATEMETLRPVPEYAWTNMKNIEGNEFCVSGG
jgi:Glyoxalase-like domain